MTASEDNFMKRNPWIIYVIIIVMGYLLYNQIGDLKKDRAEKEKTEKWSNNDYQVLVNKCMQEATQANGNYPEITKEYCECGTKLVMEHFTKKEYLRFVKKPQNEQLEIAQPIFQACLDTYLVKLKEARKK
jgi:hypothetical protein